MKKKFIKILLALVIAFFVCEISLRIFFALRIGPDVLLYGFNHKPGLTKYDKENNVAIHTNKGELYTKYLPRQVRIDEDSSGKTYQVVMNNYGFRGKDFVPGDHPKDLRIVTLGASSTFGYGDHENETYPYYLDSLLKVDARKANDTTLALNQKFQSVEVYNLGIPHQTSEQIFYLLKDEASQFKPDLVTFYEGANDAADMYRAYHKEATTSLLARVVQSSFVLKLIQFVITKKVDKMDKHQFGEYLKGKRERFVSNISRMDSFCIKNNIVFVVVTQQLHSLTLPKDSLCHYTYGQEYDLISKKLEKGQINFDEAHFLTHYYLMDTLRSWCKSNNVELIDGIKALDNQRCLMSSWVHLYPEGNRILAKAIEGKIVELEADSTR